MNRITRLLVSITALAVLASACGGADDEAAEAPSTTEAPVTSDAEGDGESTETGDSPTTSAAPTTTEAPATTTEAPTTTSSTTTTEAPDTNPPAAPTGLECLGLGGGSGEVILAFDAPSDPTDIETIRVYVDEGSGFQRVAKTTTDGAPASVGSVWDLDTTDPTTWSMGVYPVPNFVEISIAVTFGDAAGNESGWNPITVTPTFDGCS